MNKSESKYFNTAVKMDEALIALLEKKDFKYITIKEICEEAGVNRSTFYLHYEHMGDLLKETMSYMNNKFNSYFLLNEKEMREKIESGNLNELVLVTKEQLNPYLEFVRDNRKIFIAVITNPDAFTPEESLKMLSDKVFYPIMRRFDIPESKRDYMLMFYIKGIMGILVHWIKKECEDSTEFIMNLIIELIMADIKE